MIKKVFVSRSNIRSTRRKINKQFNRDAISLSDSFQRAVAKDTRVKEGNLLRSLTRRIFRDYIRVYYNTSRARYAKYVAAKSEPTDGAGAFNVIWKKINKHTRRLSNKRITIR